VSVTDNGLRESGLFLLPHLYLITVSLFDAYSLPARLGPISHQSALRDIFPWKLADLGIFYTFKPEQSGHM